MNAKQAGILAAFAAVAAVTAVGAAGIQESDAARMSTYEVTVTNIMPAQPITPPVLAVHSKDASVYTVGEKASMELVQLAENGKVPDMADSIRAMDGVMDVKVGQAGHLVAASDPGETGLPYTETFTVTAEGDKRYLSMVSMLVCTNDGFAGIDTVRLPYYDSKTVYAKAYDARSEMNTEDFADLVPPCAAESGVTTDKAGSKASSPATMEDGIVIPHPGVTGKADLSEVHMWDGPVVKIDIKRTG